MIIKITMSDMWVTSTLYGSCIQIIGAHWKCKKKKDKTDHLVTADDCCMW